MRISSLYQAAVRAVKNPLLKQDLRRLQHDTSAQHFPVGPVAAGQMAVKAGRITADAVVKELIAPQLRAAGYLPQGEDISNRYFHLLKNAAQELGKKLIESADLRSVAELVEKQRQTVASAAFEQIEFIRSRTFEHLASLNPAEKHWLAETAPLLLNLTRDILDRQFQPSHPQSRYLEHLSAFDAPSRAHFQRIRTDDLPMLRPAFTPQDVKEPKQFASSLPWFPDHPAYSGLWPEDLTAAELEYLRDRYPADHPVLRPYTVVERLTAETEQRVREQGPLKNSAGEMMESIVRGLDGARYRVVNICWHENYRETFLSLARALSFSADLQVDGFALDPSFRQYLKAMSTAMIEGDFTKWLNADLAQTEGNLFFTLFPHEGYWSDNMKFPFLVEIGIRDLSARSVAESHLDIIQQLEARVSEAKRKLGFAVTSTAKAETATTDSVEFIWTYASGGFMDAFPHGVPAGHDYPKAAYPGVHKHRNVIILDALAAVIDTRQDLINQLFEPELAELINVENSCSFTAWHEAQHGLEGNKPDTKMKIGLTLGEVFFDYWGILAEPGADLGALKAQELLFQAGKITLDQYHGTLLYSVYRAVSRVYPKNTAASDDFIEEALHIAGTMLYLGFIFKTNPNTIKFNAAGKLEVNLAELAGTIDLLDQQFLEFGLTGMPGAYLAFYRECIKAIPDDFIEKISVITALYNRPVLLRRPGDLVV